MNGMHLPRLCGLALAFIVGAPLLAVSAGPVISTVTALSASPAQLSNGNSGPINRFGFDVINFDPDDAAVRVLCIYPGSFTYICRYQVASSAAAGRRRVTVDIPDLDKGAKVTVRFVTSGGSVDALVELTNTPLVIHEIETLTFSQGGVTTTGGNGAPAPVTQLAKERANTMPAIATSSLASPPACDQTYAQWVNATATDPVFTSAFGALDGSVILSSALRRGTRVEPQSSPEWLITYPLSATRAQFIAHYEVVYRVGVCAERIASR